LLGTNSRYSISSPKGLGVSADRIAEIVASRTVKRIKQSPDDAVEAAF
jgi:hypothetical protein